MLNAVTSRMFACHGLTGLDLKNLDPPVASQTMTSRMFTLTDLEPNASQALTSGCPFLVASHALILDLKNLDSAVASLAITSTMFTSYGLTAALDLKKPDPPVASQTITSRMLTAYGLTGLDFKNVDPVE